MNCELCGLPAPTPPIRASGNSFCCVGCREVFKNFGDDILTARQPANPGKKVTGAEGAEAFLRIEGMHCSSCEALISHLAERIDGVRAATSSYATSTARIVYDPELLDECDLPALLSTSGYKVTLRSDPREVRDTDRALFRVVTSTSLAAVVMMLYLAFYYPTHLGLVDYSDLEPVRWLAFKTVPLSIFVLTSIMVAYVGLPVFRGALVGLRAGMLNMDNLLSIAILATYAYSTVQFFRGDVDELYFDVAAAILTVITVGRYFEANARSSASHELEKLMDAWTPMARVTRNGRPMTVAVGELRPGEVLVVGSGEAIPVDGIIQSGGAAVDVSLMTGEPFPVRLGPGDPAQGGTIVVEGEITLASDENAENQLETLTRILWNVQSSSAGARGMADRLARGFVPVVLVLAAAVSIWLYTSGSPAREAMLVGLATLIVSCPCTFGLAMPLAIAAGVSTALKRGIITTSADIFEKPRKFDTVIFDKTGTLSTGDMEVDRVIGAPETAAYAAAAERTSSHPIAEAIARLDQTHTAEDVKIHPGRGVVATVSGKLVAAGSAQLFETLGWEMKKSLKREAGILRHGNGVISFVGWDGIVHGAILTRDQGRAEWREVVAQFKQHSKVVLLSGAQHPGVYEADFDQIHLGVPPEAKAAIVRHYRRSGTVAMIGDGSNDAPALAEADIGVAFGAPTALAAEAADIVIPGDDLTKVFDAFAIVGATRSRIRQNLGWAILYNATAIPLALTGFLNPLFAALAMSTSSLLVVWNSSRPIPLTEANQSADPPGWTRDRIRTMMKLAQE
ncbi:MAG: cation-translocating P-type ATPase [Rhodobacteraceae bacterium]|nr:cation-translocating P-type ATPase [Paracoccaceae bacterium]